MGWGILMMGAMALLAVLLIGATVWLVLRLVRDRDRYEGSDRAPGAALEILDRRFAAGEIDVEEYRERRSALERGG